MTRILWCFQISAFRFRAPSGQSVKMLSCLSCVYEKEQEKLLDEFEKKRKTLEGKKEELRKRESSNSVLYLKTSS